MGVERIPLVVKMIPFLLVVSVSFFTQNPVLGGLVGCVSSSTILHRGNLLKAFFMVFSETIPTAMSDADNVVTVMLTVFTNAFVTLLVELKLFDRLQPLLATFVSSPEKSLLLIFGIALGIFFDDYASIFIAGGLSVSAFRNSPVPRTDFSLVIHALASPKAIFVPFSSYAAVVREAVSAVVEKDKVYATIVGSLPYQFFSVFTLAITLVAVVSGTRLQSTRKKKKTKLEPSEKIVQKELNAFQLFLPAILLMIFVGSIVANFFFSVDSSLAILNSAVLSFFLGLLLLRVPLVQSQSLFLLAFKDLVGCLLILLCFSAFKATINQLRVAADIKAALHSMGGPPAVYPPLVFLAAAFFSWCMGSSWAAVQLVAAVIGCTLRAFIETDKEIFLASVGAVISGSVTGDFISFYSDTAVLTAAVVKVDVMEHFYNLLPYGVLSFFVSLFAGFCLVFLKKLWLNYAIAGLIVGSVFFIANQRKKLVKT